jgi:two-component system, chemotaxis family, protein-glutamate methylesterase/glutaminase
MSSKATVLVVDDSAFMRKVISEIIEASEEFQVVGTARNGHDALKQIHALDPAIVTLDIEMPELDGLQTLGYIMSETPRPVVMLSAGEGSDGAESLTIRALELGAVDFIRKPSGPISLDIATVRDRLLDALHAALEVNLGGVPMLARPKLRNAERPSGADGTAKRAVVIAASTGGPRALADVIPNLPRGIDAAVLVVQHMPSGFTRSLAERLNALSALPVREAEHGMQISHGRVYLAPGGFHMKVSLVDGAPMLGLDSSPPIWGVRPSADPLFRSATEVFGSDVVGVVLTGMGRDGAAGLRAIRDAGGRGIVQNRESSIVYGMPQAALTAAGADRIAAIQDVAATIVELLDAKAVA